MVHVQVADTVREHPRRAELLNGRLDRAHHVQVWHGVELDVLELVLERIGDAYDPLRLTRNLVEAAQAGPGVARVGRAAKDYGKDSVTLVCKSPQSCTAAKELVVRVSDHSKNVHRSSPRIMQRRGRNLMPFGAWCPFPAVPRFHLF